MTMTKSFPTQDPAGQPVTDTRRVFAGLVARNADGTPRPGILPPVPTVLVAGRASMAYDVAPFIAATARFNNGIELVANDALMQVATDPAPNANSRIDVIYVRSRFLQHADGSNLVELGVAKGLAAAIPQKPSIPLGALELAWATIPSTATTTLSNGVVITQTYQCTAAAGGVVPFRNRAELDSWLAPDGAFARDLSTNARYERIGGAWLTSEPGLFIVRPTSVAGTGVSIANDGTVVFTNVSDINADILGVFSSRFRNYRMVSRFTSKQSVGIDVECINGSTPITTASYFSNTQALVNSGRQDSYAGASSWMINLVSLFSGAQAGSSLDVYTPNEPQRTTFMGNAFATGGVLSSAVSLASLETSDVVTGLRIRFPAGAQATGTLKFYGYA